MTPSTQTGQNTTKYLTYGAVALLFVNFILIFLPFLEVYQPSRSVTILGQTMYEDWQTQSVPMAMLVLPVIETGIPYLCTMISFLIALGKKNPKNAFLKLKTNTLDKPVRFFWLKFGAIVNVLAMWVIFSIGQSHVGDLEKHGAYCRLTVFGILNVICTVAFVILLFVLSHQTKSMFTLVKKAQPEASETQQIAESAAEQAAKGE